MRHGSSGNDSPRRACEWVAEQAGLAARAVRRSPPGMRQRIKTTVQWPWREILSTARPPGASHGELCSRCPVAVPHRCGCPKRVSVLGTPASCAVLPAQGRAVRRPLRK